MPSVLASDVRTFRVEHPEDGRLIGYVRYDPTSGWAATEPLLLPFIKQFASRFTNIDDLVDATNGYFVLRGWGNHAVAAAGPPDEERDYHGRWSGDGSGSILKSDRFAHAARAWVGGEDYAQEPMTIPEGGTSAKVPKEDVATILKTIKEEGTPSTKTLYRGLTMTKDQLAELTPGGKVDLHVSSFTPLRHNAEDTYADPFHDMSSSRSKSVVMVLDPGAKVVDISKYSRAAFDEPEIVTAGRFKVTDVKTGWWLGNFVEGDRPDSDYVPMTQVHIKAVSR